MDREILMAVIEACGESILVNKKFTNKLVEQVRELQAENAELKHRLAELHESKTGCDTSTPKVETVGEDGMIHTRFCKGEGCAKVADMGQFDVAPKVCSEWDGKSENHPCADPGCVDG